MSDLPKDAGAGDPPDDEIEVDLEAIDPEPPEEDEPLVDDEPEAPEGDDEPEPAPARGAQPPPRRGSARVQALANENRDLKARVSTFETQLQGLLNERRQPTQAEQAAAQEQERQHFELMSPYEQFQYTQAKINEGVSRQTQQVAAGLWDQNDQRDYAALLESNPAYRRYEDSVADLKKQAPGVSRRVLLATAIGLKALDQGGAAKTRAGKAAGVVAARQAAQPPAARGDVQADRGRRGDTLEDRLRGQAI